MSFEVTPQWRCGKDASNGNDSEVPKVTANWRENYVEAAE
jgi:hypothetical protein